MYTSKESCTGWYNLAERSRRDNCINNLTERTCEMRKKAHKIRVLKKKLEQRRPHHGKCGTKQHRPTLPPVFSPVLPWEKSSAIIRQDANTRVIATVDDRVLLNIQH